MPKIGEVLSVRAAGLTTSLAPMTSATSVCLELVVDVVELEDHVVGHAGLGQQHVHLARHAAGHRMDRELDRRPAACSSLTNS
jgi:hypothetical protein